MSKSRLSWKSSILSEDNLIKDVIKNLNKSNLQIALITRKKLIGTITDGDIRRGLLKGYSIKENLKKILKNSITVSPDTSYKEAKDIMKSKSILQIPIVSKDRKVLGLHVWNKEYTSKKKLFSCYHGRRIWKKDAG